MVQSINTNMERQLNKTNVNKNIGLVYIYTISWADSQTSQVS
jgi:hypothetical protein